MADNNKISEELLRRACDFGASLQVARKKCREAYRGKESEPRNRLRIILDGMMVMLGDALQTPIGNTSEASSYQIGVAASFIRTHFLVCDLILDGEVIEAFVLVRKQLELLARLNELDSKPLAKLHRQTPNIQNALKGGAGRIYGELSEIAHFSTPRVAEFLHVVEDGLAIGPSLLPVYSDRYVGCMDLEQFIAIHFAQWLIVKLNEWYPGMDSKKLMGVFLATFDTALEAGVVRIESPKSNVSTSTPSGSDRLLNKSEPPREGSNESVASSGNGESTISP